MSFLPQTGPGTTWTNSATTARAAAPTQSLDHALTTAQCLVLSRQLGASQLLAAFTHIDATRRYSIHADSRDIVGWAAEQPRGWTWLQRIFLRGSRPLHLAVRVGEQVVMTLDRRWSFFGYASMFVRDATGAPLAEIAPRFTILRRRLSIRDPSGALIGVVTGPFFRPWTFELRFGTSEDAPIAATVQRRWGGIMRDLFMDAETFALMLPGNGDLALARIALATAILVDCCYFEHSYAVDEAAPAAGLLSIAWRIARGLMSR